MKRKRLPIAIQLEVWFRDRWLCHVCRRPLVFPFALKHLGQLVEANGIAPPLAYYHLNWRRDSSPLLDELGASIDHVEALSKGGADAIENLAAICARCNARKSSSPLKEFVVASKPWRVKGKHGEPVAWDGLTSVFVALADRSSKSLSETERQWLVGLRTYYPHRNS
jgi:5-methylcytosine-specific restriction endonuclease McrA